MLDVFDIRGFYIGVLEGIQLVTIFSIDDSGNYAGLLESAYAVVAHATIEFSRCCAGLLESVHLVVVLITIVAQAHLQVLFQSVRLFLLALVGTSWSYLLGGLLIG